MAKYIEADSLKAKLDEYYREYQSKYMETRTPYTQGLIDALDLAEQVIDSLQQEQHEVDLEKEIDNYLERLQAWQIQEAPFNNMDKCARYFYELGLKAK